MFLVLYFFDVYLQNYCHFTAMSLLKVIFQYLNLMMLKYISLLYLLTASIKIIIIVAENERNLIPHKMAIFICHTKFNIYTNSINFEDLVTCQPSLLL